MLEKTTTNTTLRPFTFEDAQAVVDLFNAKSQHLFGRNELNIDQMMNEWTSPGLNVEEVIRVVEDENGQIIGYIDVWDTSPPHVIKYAWGCLHPQHWDEQLFKQMISMGGRLCSKTDRSCARWNACDHPPGHQQ